MKVLFELTHTGVDREIMKAPHDFLVFGPEWDFSNRPAGPNMFLGSDPGQHADVAVVGTLDGLRKIRPEIPVIWKCLTDWGKHLIPYEVVSRVSAFVSTCKETAARHGLESHKKSVIIEQGIDPDVWKGYVGDLPWCLSVGNMIMKRPEKGPDVLVAVNKLQPVNLMGAMNDGYDPKRIVTCSKSQEGLAEAYRHYRVYFNPSTVIVCAVLEAMVTGMPVVTMVPGNYIPLMRHNRNCLIAKSPTHATRLIELLMRDRVLRESIGAEARESVQYRFHPALVAWKWDQLLKQVTKQVPASSNLQG